MRHLTGEQALDRLIEVEKAYHIRHGRAPTRITLPFGIALYLLKLGHGWFSPEYAKVLWYEGIRGWEKLKLHGMAVKIGWSPRARLKVS